MDGPVKIFFYNVMGLDSEDGAKLRPLLSKEISKADNVYEGKLKIFTVHEVLPFCLCRHCPLHLSFF